MPDTFEQKPPPTRSRPSARKPVAKAAAAVSASPLRVEPAGAVAVEVPASSGAANVQAVLTLLDATTPARADLPVDPVEDATALEAPHSPASPATYDHDDPPGKPAPELSGAPLNERATAQSPERTGEPTAEQHQGAAAMSDDPAAQHSSGPPPGLISRESRVLIDLGWLGLAWPWLSLAPMGDGHPVLVLPALLMDDNNTALLRTFLRSRGYTVYGCGRGRRNAGQWQTVEDDLLPWLDEIHAEHGRKVSVVGWSMGGLFARELAWRRPDAVRSVISLSSMVEGPPRSCNIWPLYEAVSGQPAETLLKSPPPGVPSTSVVSPIEGVNTWQACLQPASPLTENVAVMSSHHGLAFHPAALHLVADRLAQREGEWTAFQRPAWDPAGWFFPSLGALETLATLA